MEAISAIDVFTARNPIHATKNIQIKPAVPPLISPIIAVLLPSACLLWPSQSVSWTNPNMVSQLAMRIIEKPKMDTNRKFRCV